MDNSLLLVKLSQEFSDLSMEEIFKFAELIDDLFPYATTHEKIAELNLALIKEGGIKAMLGAAGKALGFGDDAARANAAAAARKVESEGVDQAIASMKRHKVPEATGKSGKTWGRERTESGKTWGRQRTEIDAASSSDLKKKLI